MSIYEIIARMQGVLLWVKANPAKARQLLLYKTCKPLWKHLYRKRIEQEEKESNSIRLPLQTFRYMVKERWGDTIRVAVRDDCVEIIDISSEKAVFTLPVERNETGLPLVVWPNDLKVEE